MVSLEVFGARSGDIMRYPRISKRLQYGVSGAACGAFIEREDTKDGATRSTTPMSLSSNQADHGHILREERMRRGVHW